MSTRTVRILGAGPAGASAAIAAAQQGAQVTLYDPSRFPRHKVCGEFLSPGTAPVLERLGLTKALAGAVPIRELRLHLGRKEVRHRLPENAYGLSRFTLDHLLLEEARRLGATVVSERRQSIPRPAVIASGRSRIAPAGQDRDSRVFASKAHFEGPAYSAVELFFFDGCYFGVSPVEGGATNVCGLGPAGTLRRFGFQVDELLESYPPLRARLRPLRRKMEWMSTGPLSFTTQLPAAAEEDVYLAGDTLSFVDPFTGSGLMSAMLTGSLAGVAASTGTPVGDYLSWCSAALSRTLSAASLFRFLLRSGWAESLLKVAPPSLLFRLTRPRAVTPPRLSLSSACRPAGRR